MKKYIVISISLSSLLYADLPILPIAPPDIDSGVSAPSGFSDSDSYCDLIGKLNTLFDNKVTIYNGCNNPTPTPQPTFPNTLPTNPKESDSYCSTIEYLSSIFGSKVDFAPMRAKCNETPTTPLPSSLPMNPKEYDSYCSALKYISEIMGNKIDVTQNLDICSAIIEIEPSTTPTSTPYYEPEPITAPTTVTVTNSQPFNTTQTLPNGKSADIKVGLNSTNLDVKVSVNGESSEVKAPKDLSYSVDSKGNTNIKVSENIKLQSSRDGTVKIEHIGSNVTLPLGSKVEINSDKSISITKEKVVGDITYQTNILISKDGLMSVELVVTNKAPLDYKIPNSATDLKLSINDNSISVSYKILSSINLLSTTKNRAVTYGYNSINIVPKGNANIEEKVYFDGKKSITLRSGSSSIVLDGKTIEMEKDKEYIVVVVQEAQLKEIYFDNALNLNKGWNLISSPINSDINLSLSNIKSKYKYDSNKWISNFEILKPQEGVWILFDTNQTKIDLSSYKNLATYDINESKVTNVWNLLGAGENISTQDLNYTTIWAFDNYKWFKNPSQILRGYGFWLKK